VRELIMDIRERYMAKVKRVVIKVGSSTLTHPNGLLNLHRIELITRQIVDIHNRGIDVILVTSGAVAAGMGKLGLTSRPKSVPRRQACASVGQVTLMHMYDKMFSEYGKTVSQILISKEDVDHTIKRINARNTFDALLEEQVIPVVNENDAIATEELEEVSRFGDNDTLSAFVAKLVEADLLILMSDIDGLYDSNPSVNSDAKFISLVTDIDDNIIKCAGAEGSNLGTGGMITKLKAGKIVLSGGAGMVIVNGSKEGIIEDVIDGKDVGTFFISKNL
jgi:glutamate 5-kinase